MNVAVADLLDVEFPVEVATALGRHDLDPANLILEVTESSIMSDRVRIGDVLGRLIAAPSEVEVGIVTALLGAPLLFHLATRRDAR